MIKKISTGWKTGLVALAGVDKFNECISTPHSKIWREVADDAE